MEKRKRTLPLTSSLVIVLSSAPDRAHGLGVEIFIWKFIFFVL